MPIGIPAAMLLTSAIGGGTQALGAWQSNRAQSKAFQSQQDFDRYQFDQQLALQRARDAEAKREYDAQQAAQAPYQKLRLAAIGQLAKHYGLNLPDDFFAATPTAAPTLATLGTAASAYGGGANGMPTMPTRAVPTFAVSTPAMAAATAPGGTLADLPRLLQLYQARSPQVTGATTIQ
jgi:hypothetical protein